MYKICYTLIFVKQRDLILLGFKKRGFGSHKWNGYGGKLEDEEDPFECAIRELCEESNLHVKRDDLTYLGVINYYECNRKGPNRVVYIFTVCNVSGSLLETEEMKPKWFNFKDIPYQDMWPDSTFWIPLVLKNVYFEANFIYKDHCEIVSQDVKQLTMPPLLNTDMQMCNASNLCQYL